MEGDSHSEDELTELEPPSKKQKVDKNKSSLYKPPTSDEINQLLETENLFKSSLFRMQITELLGEIQLTKKRETQIDRYIKEISEVLKGLPCLEKRKLMDQKWVKKLKVHVPIKQEPYELDGDFKFLPPTNVSVIGSYGLGTCIKPHISVDITVEMRKGCIGNKDNINHRYLRKRALYLTFIASHIQKHEIVQKVEFVHHNGNHMKPILAVTPSEKFGKHFKVHIHTSIEDGIFPLSKFSLKQRNIRTEWYYGSELEDDLGPPTPQYNTIILHDMLHCKHTEHLSQHFQNSKGVKEGIALLQVWMHQRKLDVGRGSISHFVIASYVAYLLGERKLNRLMSSYQVMRITLLHLSQSNWSEEGISLADYSTPDRLRPLLQEFDSVFDVVFVDQSGYVNLTADVSSATFNMLKDEAALALKYLDSAGTDSFEVLFMKPVSFTCKMDQVIVLDNLDQLKKSAKKLKLEDSLLDNCGDYVATYLPVVVKLLNRAIGRRINILCQKFESPKKWSISESPPICSSGNELTFGLVMNSDNFTSIVDKGPPANSEEAKEFRSFWGELSELRRFQDGTICEAVVWSAEEHCNKRLLTGTVVKHILNRHLGIDKNSITYVGGQLDSLLKVPFKGETAIPYGTGEEPHKTLIQSYDALCKELRTLKDFPLQINSLEGISPAFRYSEVFPDLPVAWKGDDVVDKNKKIPLSTKSCPTYVSSVKVVCILEASGKWPEDAEAVKRLKAAFHIKLGQLLTQQCNLTTDVHPTYVDVLKDGYVFRVMIGYIKEISLMQLVTTPEGMIKSVKTQEAYDLERELIILPKLTATLGGIHQMYPSYSSTVRLVKRWISAHMMDNFLEPEAVELIVASQFIHPAPYSVPASPQTGFLRFLTLMASHNWKTTPLIVDLNNELTKKDIGDIERVFEKNRDMLPLMFIACPYDKFSSMWTKRTPKAPILQRLALLAKQSFTVLEKVLFEKRNALELKQVFRPPLEFFDVIIHLKSEKLTRQHLAIDINKRTSIPTCKKFDSAGDKRMPVTDFDPAHLYVRELQDTYENLALFFHDTYGGDMIGVLWNPNAFVPQSFKAASVECCMLKTDSRGENVQVVPNVEAIIEDFNIMGAEIVQRIEIKRTI